MAFEEKQRYLAYYIGIAQYNHFSNNPVGKVYIILDRN